MWGVSLPTDDDDEEEEEEEVLAEARGKEADGRAVRRKRRANVGGAAGPRLRRPPRGARAPPPWIGSFRSSGGGRLSLCPSSEPSRNLSPNRPRTGERVEMMTAAATTFPAHDGRPTSPDVLARRDPRRAFDGRRLPGSPASRRRRYAFGAAEDAPRPTTAPLFATTGRAAPDLGTSVLDRCSSPPPCPSPFERTRRSRGGIFRGRKRAAGRAAARRGRGRGGGGGDAGDGATDDERREASRSASLRRTMSAESRAGKRKRRPVSLGEGEKRTKTKRLRDDPRLGIGRTTRRFLRPARARARVPRGVPRVPRVPRIPAAC